MAEFQEMVYASQQLESDRRLSESNVDRAYNFLVKNMLGNGIEGRSPSSWAGVRLPDALAQAGVLETVKSASTRKEKMMVIESVMLALRNDASTK